MTEPEKQMTVESIDGSMTITPPDGPVTMIMSDGRIFDVISPQPVAVRTKPAVDVAHVLAQAAHNAYHLTPDQGRMADPARWRRVAEAVRDAHAPYVYPTPDAYRAATQALSRHRRLGDELAGVANELLTTLQESTKEGSLGEATLIRLRDRYNAILRQR